MPRAKRFIRASEAEVERLRQVVDRRAAKLDLAKRRLAAAQRRLKVVKQ